MLPFLGVAVRSMMALLVLSLLESASASDSVAAVSGITEAVFATPALFFPFVGSAGRDGRLQPGSIGNCFVVREHRRAWWVFQFEVPELSPATYTCRVGARQHTLEIQSGDAPIAGKVRGEFFCGKKLEPIIPPMPQPDGSTAIQTITRTPCSEPQFAGGGLPFAWP